MSFVDVVMVGRGGRGAQLVNIELIVMILISNTTITTAPHAQEKKCKL